MFGAAWAEAEAGARHEYWRALDYWLPEMQRAIERGEERDALTPAMLAEARARRFVRKTWQRAPSWLRLPAGAKAAVLCPGASLRQTWGGHGYATVIAVNRAAAAVPAVPWVVALDEAPLRAHGGQATLGVMSTKACLARVRPGVSTLDESILPQPIRLAATQFSKLAAITLGAWLGAEQVDVYGDDMAGGAYCDGAALASVDVMRWGRERALTRMVVRHLRDVEHVKVARVMGLASCA